MSYNVGKKAIRINGTEILQGIRHINILVGYMSRENLTDDQVDAMIDSGKIEFGCVFITSTGLEFSEDEVRKDVYTSLSEITWIGGGLI